MHFYVSKIKHWLLLRVEDILKGLESGYNRH